MTNIKLKKFDIALAQAGAKIVTRDHRDVKLIAYCPDDLVRYPVIAILAGKDNVDTYTISGSWQGSDLSPESDDLFLAVETTTVYVNLYSLPTGIWIGYPTEAEALAASKIGALAIAIPVVIEIKE